MYKFITVNPIPAPLGDILEVDSPVNQGIRAETAMALAASKMLEAMEEVSVEITRLNKAAGETVFNPAATSMLRAAIAKAKA